MPDAEDALSPPPGSTPSEMFPVLTSSQQARVLAHGQRRNVEQGEIVIELNERITKVFVVVSGQLHILQVANNQEHVVAICNAGMFTGEINVLTGRRGVVRIRAAEESELIEIEREALQGLVETDSELSDILLRSFILRRLELIAREAGDIVLIGSSHSLDTFRIKEFLTRATSAAPNDFSSGSPRSSGKAFPDRRRKSTCGNLAARGYINLLAYHNSCNRNSG